MAAMGGIFRRKLPVTLIVVFVAIAGAVLWAVWRSPHRDDLSTFGAFAAAVIVPLISLCVFIAKFEKRTSSGQGRTPSELAERLAQVVGDQWGDAAQHRHLQPPIPLRWKVSYRSAGGPLAAAVGSHRVTPLPGLPPTTKEQLLQGRIQDLHAIYGGLGSGRLVIIGSPGSGKSGTAVLLILAALRYRQGLGAEREQVPVPVMFTLHGWDPRNTPFKDWLAERLRQDYSLFQGSDGPAEAAALVKGNRIAVILDGLDEIPEELRPIALEALSEQTSFRVVILGRSDETTAAVQQEFLSTAVALELQEVDAETAADYLTSVQRDPPPAGWAQLTGYLSSTPDSPLAKALSNPLMLTLVRDTYRAGDDVRELLDFCGTEGDLVSPTEIEDHLLDRVLPAAYKAHPGEEQGYDLAAAERALSRIAKQMNEDGTRDLAWWQIPVWTSFASRWIAMGVVMSLVCGFVIRIRDGLPATVGGGLIVGFGFAAWVVAGRRPRRIARVRFQQLFALSRLWLGLWFGLSGAVVFWLESGFAVAVVAGPIIGLALWIVPGFLAALSAPGEENANPLTPLGSWRHDRFSALIMGVAVAITVGVLGALSDQIGYSGPIGHFMESLITRAGLPATGRSEVALLQDLASALYFGVIVTLGFSGTWAASCAFAQLAGRWHTPVRLLLFLDDARKREVLRTVGPVYQFRHARLQDRLAGETALAVSAQVPVVAQDPAAAGEVSTKPGESRPEPPGKLPQAS
jgi:hypothetical protein